MPAGRQEGSPVPSSAAAAVHINQCAGVLESRKRLLCRKHCPVCGISPVEKLCWQYEDKELAPR